ncbi:MAG: 2-amino-4-hydroxy-6-hydroxymethyldihydropteridine diphosphokinase, partial [Anaerolineales bacterium]|nr:2-amino-4-hydroxy-6-hydroxymethyldihydropteridine diphosphokinase [Anaerolineales bacterium]
MNTVYLILGSNINKEVNLPEAVRLLRELTTVVQVAGVYETVPVGLLEQPLFWNTAVSIHTLLAPAALKVNVLAA